MLKKRSRNIGEVGSEGDRIWRDYCIVRCYIRTQQTRDIDPIVDQRRRRCANVNPTLGQCCNNNDSCQNSTTVLPWALNNAGAGYFMQYIYIYIIIKYVALILLNYEYIIYRT